MADKVNVLRKWAETLNGIADVLEEKGDKTFSDDRADHYQWDAPKGQTPSPLAKAFNQLLDIPPLTIVLGSPRSETSILVNCVTFDGDYPKLMDVARDLQMLQSGIDLEDDSASIH